MKTKKETIRGIELTGYSIPILKLVKDLRKKNELVSRAWDGSGADIWIETLRNRLLVDINSAKLFCEDGTDLLCLYNSEEESGEVILTLRSNIYPTPGQLNSSIAKAIKDISSYGEVTK